MLFILLKEVIIKLLGSFHFMSHISKLHVPSVTYSLLLTYEALFEKSFENDYIFWLQPFYEWQQIYRFMEKLRHYELYLKC